MALSALSSVGEWGIFRAMSDRSHCFAFRTGSRVKLLDTFDTTSQGIVIFAVFDHRSRVDITKFVGSQVKSGFALTTRFEID